MNNICKIKITFSQKCELKPYCSETVFVHYMSKLFSHKTALKNRFQIHTDELDITYNICQKYFSYQTT